MRLSNDKRNPEGYQRLQGFLYLDSIFQSQFLASQILLLYRCYNFFKVKNAHGSNINTPKTYF